MGIDPHQVHVSPTAQGGLREQGTKGFRPSFVPSSLKLRQSGAVIDPCPRRLLSRYSQLLVSLLHCERFIKCRRQLVSFGENLRPLKTQPVADATGSCNTHSPIKTPDRRQKSGLDLLERDRKIVQQHSVQQHRVQQHHLVLLLEEKKVHVCLSCIGV